MFGDVTLPAVTERAGARTMGWVEVGPPATMNARYNHNSRGYCYFALHKIKRKIGVSSRSVGFSILFFSFFKVIVFVCCSLLLKLIGKHSIISDTDTDDQP